MIFKLKALPKLIALNHAKSIIKYLWVHIREQLLPKIVSKHTEQIQLKGD